MKSLDEAFKLADLAGLRATTIAEAAGLARCYVSQIRGGYRPRASDSTEKIVQAISQLADERRRAIESHMAACP